MIVLRLCIKNPSRLRAAVFLSLKHRDLLVPTLEAHHGAHFQAPQWTYPQTLPLDCHQDRLSLDFHQPRIPVCVKTGKAQIIDIQALVDGSNARTVSLVVIAPHLVILRRK